MDTKPFKYQKLKEYFIRSIRKGSLEHGARVPSEPELIKQYKLSRNTIRQAMKELENEGYVYRIRGKGTFVKVKRDEGSKKIALIIFDIEQATHPLVTKMIRGIDLVLSDHGYALDVLASNRTELEADVPKLINDYAGFIIGAWQIDKSILAELEQKNSPYLFIKNYLPEMKNKAAVIDFKKGGMLVAKHLAMLGHKNIALLYAGDSLNISSDFKDGVVTTCVANGVVLKNDNIIDIGFASESANTAVDFLINSDDCVSAIITFDDDIAAVVVQRLKASGLRVPEDISVTGCNDMPIASLLSPALTTVSIPVDKLGSESAKILLKLVDGKLKEFKGLKLSPEIVLRKSTCKYTRTVKQNI
jgi:GntR family transcriptional regulator of arabinose operon